MKTVTPALTSHLQSETTTLCSCWLVTRTDGVVYGFTDHDQSLLIDGIEYIETSGYFRSAISNSATVQNDSLEVKGFLDNDLISERDLIFGLYDYADVEIFMVNWADLSMGRIRLRYGKFGEVTRWPSGLFVVELRGLMQMYQQTVGQIFTPECRADLGDSRCGAGGLALVPEARRSNSTYAIGARIIAPSTAVAPKVRLNVLNGDFEQMIFTNTFGPVGLTNAQVLNVGFQADTGSFALQTTGATGSFGRYVYPKNWVHSPVLPDVTNAGTKYRLGIKGKAFAPNAQMRFYVVWSNTEYNINLSNQRSDWIDVAQGDYQEITYEVAQFVNVQFDRIGFNIEFQTTDATTAQLMFDTMSVDFYDPATDQWYSVSQTDEPRLDFEPNGLESGTAVANWSGGQVLRRSANVNLTPYSGTSYMVNVADGPDYTQQTIALNPGLPITDAMIDAAAYQIDINMMIGAEDSGWEGGVIVDFLNGSGQQIYGVSLDKYQDAFKGGWMPFNLKGPVPPTARSVRIKLAVEPTTRKLTNAKVAFDAFTIDIFESDDSFYDELDGVEYVCVGGGTSALIAPTFDPTIGAVTTDGMVQWRAVVPAYTYVGTVTSVANFTTFTASGLSAVANGYFNFGVLRWLSGPNKGRMIECKTWVQPDQLVTMLPLSFKPSVGEKFAITAGCDKSRETCDAKFNNILNFRGEPDLPGTGQYFKVAVQA